MYAAIPIPRDTRPPVEDKALDPFSRSIHRSVMAMDDRPAGILYAYYVRQVGFDAKPHVFRQYGISRTKFYEVLKDATLMAYNSARRLDSEVNPWPNMRAEVSPQFE
jgi:hypothetical protein